MVIFHAYSEESSRCCSECCPGALASGQIPQPNGEGYTVQGPVWQQVGAPLRFRVGLFVVHKLSTDGSTLLVEETRRFGTLTQMKAFRRNQEGLWTQFGETIFEESAGVAGLSGDGNMFVLRLNLENRFQVYQYSEQSGMWISVAVDQQVYDGIDFFVSAIRVALSDDASTIVLTGILASNGSGVVRVLTFQNASWSVARQVTDVNFDFSDRGSHSVRLSGNGNTFAVSIVGFRTGSPVGRVVVWGRMNKSTKFKTLACKLTYGKLFFWRGRLDRHSRALIRG